MTRNKIIYIAIVALLGASLLLGFAEEVFRLDFGSASWAAHWATSPVALVLGFAFALIFGKTFPDFNKVMSKKLLQYSVIGLGFGMNVNAALASGSEGMMFTIVSVFGHWLLVGCSAESFLRWTRRPVICSVQVPPSVAVRL